MISREKAIEWAIASGAKPLCAEVDIEFIEDLVNRAYAEGQKDAKRLETNCQEDLGETE